MTLLEKNIQLNDPHGKGAVLARETFDQIFESIVNTIGEMPDGVIELNYLIESVEKSLAGRVKENLSWKILQVKKHLETTGDLTVKYTYGRVPIISLASKAKSLAKISRAKEYPVKITVVFSLIHEKFSEKEADFLWHSKVVASLPYVDTYECHRNSGRLNNYDFGMYITFRSYKAYEQYTNHKKFLDFISNRWTTEVKEFVHVGYEPMSSAGLLS